MIACNRGGSANEREEGGEGENRERRAERADSVRAAIACRGASLPRGKYCTSSKLHPTPLIRTQPSSCVGNALIASQLGQLCDSPIRLSLLYNGNLSTCIRATTSSSHACLNDHLSLPQNDTRSRVVVTLLEGPEEPSESAPTSTGAACGRPWGFGRHPLIVGGIPATQPAIPGRPTSKSCSSRNTSTIHRPRSSGDAHEDRAKGGELL